MVTTESDAVVRDELRVPACACEKIHHLPQDREDNKHCCSIAAISNPSANQHLKHKNMYLERDENCDYNEVVENLGSTLQAVHLEESRR